MATFLAVAISKLGFGFGVQIQICRGNQFDENGGPIMIHSVCYSITHYTAHQWYQSIGGF